MRTATGTTQLQCIDHRTNFAGPGEVIFAMHTARVARRSTSPSNAAMAKRMAMRALLLNANIDLGGLEQCKICHASPSGGPRGRHDTRRSLERWTQKHPLHRLCETFLMPNILHDVQLRKSTTCCLASMRQQLLPFMQHRFHFSIEISHDKF